MKIKSLLIAMMAICLTMGITSCKDDKDDPIENNYTIYQKAVNETVMMPLLKPTRRNSPVMTCSCPSPQPSASTVQQPVRT